MESEFNINNINNNASVGRVYLKYILKEMAEDIQIKILFLSDQTQELILKVDLQMKGYKKTWKKIFCWRSKGIG